MSTESQLFTAAVKAESGMAALPFGVRHPVTKRYKMPLLPGEAGTKAGGDWVPRGMQSATNLAGSISETRALGIWERERSQLGLALRPDLYEKMRILVKRIELEGFDFATQKLKETPAGLKLQEELAAIHEEARQACGANAPGIKGTNRHDVWEVHGFSGQYVGTPEINEQLMGLSALLAAEGLRRLPGLSERVVRNMKLNCCGRFDDVLELTRDRTFPDGVHLSAGTKIMSDLKTKRNAFWGYLEPRIQLTVYATADYMLDSADDGAVRYIQGPKYHVNQGWAVLLHMPSDGAPPVLKRVNLAKGILYAQLARQVCDARSEAKGVAAHREAQW